MSVGNCSKKVQQESSWPPHEAQAMQGQFHVIPSVQKNTPR